MVLPLSLLERIVATRPAACSPLGVSRLLSTSPSRWARSLPAAGSSEERSYSDTLHLPKTPFPLRADAAKREKLFRARTTDVLYAWQAKQLERPLFVLHDGPPYANGNLHTGHAMNKTLKDMINRSKLLQGYRVHYVPGYDTHGLPLELKALSALKLPAASLSPQKIRAAARQEAEKGIEVQGREFREFGGMGAFGSGEAYQTMDWTYEKRQLQVVSEMVAKGLITTHHRPTLYSPSSRTALAEAELEYKDDHISRSVYVAFPVADLGGLAGVDDAAVAERPVSLAVWTTTSWTLPSNVAIAASPSMEYALVENEADHSLLVVATGRIEALGEILSTNLRVLATFPGSVLLDTTYTSPLHASTSPSAPRPLIPASYVTSTTGTGLVHTAPAHGMEDWEAWRAFQLASRPGEPLKDVLCAVDGAGRFSDVLGELVEDDVRMKLEGKDVLKDGTQSVIELLQERGTLLKEVEVSHKFPYDWRTKKPVIFRASSQWFANLEKVKEDAVKAIDEVDFYPPRGRKVLELFVRGRSEWCISRQRAWGVPLPVVYSYPTSSSDPIASSTPHLTTSNIAHIVSVLDAHGTGTDYWWEGAAEEFVEPAELARSKAEGRSWRKGTDTMDVWFDSGCSWTLLRELGLRPSGAPGDLPFADVYLEGSDQHRGWFQSSLLTAISASSDPSPKAPYGTVITHGMVLDEKGRKMSKSLGNVLSPLTVIHGGKNLKKEPAYGVDLLRVWVASVDSTRDVPIGPSILAQTFEGLRKVRNTARFMLGNLSGANVEAFTPSQLGLIERYVLNELYELDQASRDAYNSYAFNRAHGALMAFSNSTLSSLYFDIIKDSLYADAESTPQRQQILFTLQTVLDTYTHILAPMAPHLAEEIHHFASGATVDPEPDATVSGSFFQRPWIPVDPMWCDPVVKAETESLIAVRDEVMSLLEQARAEKLLGSSTEAQVIIVNPSPVLLKHVDVLKTLFIVSDVKLSSDALPASATWSFAKDVGDSSEKRMRITVVPAAALKCPRCWTYTRQAHEDVCCRCANVLK